MNWRLHEALLSLGILWGGYLWTGIAVLILLYLSFANLVRSFVLAMTLFLLQETWFTPVVHTVRVMRWWFLGVVFVRAVMYLARARKPPNETRVPQLVLGALCLLAVASSVWSRSPAFTAQLAVSFGVGIVLTFGLVWRLLDDERTMPAACKAVVGLALLVFGLGFLVGIVAQSTGAFTFLTAVGWPFGAGAPAGVRYSGMFYNANMAGVLGALTLPIVLATPRQYLGALAKFRWITLVLVVATVFLSGSRSSAVACGVACLLLATYRWGAGVPALAVILVSTLGLAIYVGAIDERVDSGALGHLLRIDKLSTLSGRTELWEMGWYAGLERPLFGHGWGASRSLSGLDLERALALGSHVGGTNLHNAHLQLFVDLGAVGVALFWTFCGLLIRSGVILLRSARSPNSALVMVLYASSMALLADTITHGWVFSTGGATALAFWFCSSVVLKETGKIERRERLRVSRSPRPAFRPGTPVPAHGPAA